MPRTTRVDVGGEMYHIINRANGRMQIFNTDKDYQLFESLLIAKPPRTRSVRLVRVLLEKSSRKGYD